MPLTLDQLAERKPKTLDELAGPKTLDELAGGQPKIPFSPGGAGFGVPVTGAIGESLIDKAGIPEIFKGIREMVSPTTPYTQEESDRMAREIPKRLKLALTYYASLGGRLGPKGLREDLLKQAEDLTGFGPALMPAAGETGTLAIEWGVIFPELFKAVGMGGEAIGKIPRVAKATEAIKKMGGLNKLAEQFPRRYAQATNIVKAMEKGGAVGGTIAGAEAIGKDMEPGEVLRHVGKRAALIGGIAGTFQAASEIDTARYVKQLRTALIKVSNQRFAGHLNEVDAMPRGAARSAAYKSLTSLKQTELQNIDKIVSQAEAQLLGLKKGKLYQLGQEQVESPQKAAERLMKYGLEPRRGAPTGVEALQKGLAKTEPFIEMPMTRVAEIVETSKAAMQAARHPLRAAGQVQAGKVRPTLPKVPPKVTPPPVRLDAITETEQQRWQRVQREQEQAEADVAEMDRELAEIQKRPATEAIAGPQPLIEPKTTPEAVEMAPEAVTAPKKAPETEAQTRGDVWKGKAWRAEIFEPSEFEIEGRTAKDIVDHEVEYLGNIETTGKAYETAEQLGLDLSKIAANRLLWVAKTEQVAERYGGAEEIKLPQGSVILATDPDEGYLVLKPPAVAPKAEGKIIGEGTTPNANANMILKTKDGTIYESNDRIHALMLDRFNIQADDVARLGIMSEGKIQWSDEKGIDLTRRGGELEALAQPPAYPKDRPVGRPAIAEAELTKPTKITPELTKPTEKAPKVTEIHQREIESEREAKTIEELQAEIDSYMRDNKDPPTELLAEFNAATRRQKGGGQKPPEPPVTFKEPPRPEGPNVLMLAEVEKRLDEKAMLSEKRKLRPGGRRLAKQFIGKTDLRKMTEEELSKFGQVINRLPEPTYNNKGERIPPSIPKTTAVTKAGEFEREYTEPTLMKLLHAPEYYAEKLGVKSLVEKAEAGKIKFSLEYQQLSNKVDKWIKQIDKLGKTSIAEKAKAKLRNIPTKAVARFRELLDTHDEPPDSLTPQEKELFNNFRELTRWLLKRENAVRESLELEPIRYRKAYVRHVAKGTAKDMMEGRYPFPQGRKFWAEEIIAKKMYNPMEMHRTMTEDLEELFSRDLGFASKSMLWTALKEIHLSQPIRYLEQQLTYKGKDTPVYKNLSPSEQARWDKVATIPSRTRRWVKDYVNTTIKGQQSQLDQDIEAIVKKTGLNGLLNKFLKPFGKTLSYKPVSSFFTRMGRAQIMGVLGGPIGGRPRQIMRNKFQTLQNMALYPLYKETWRTYAPIRALRKTTPDLERLLNKSLFLKAYTGTEEWPVDIKSKIAKGSLAAYQWSAVTNARQAMECAYWGMLPLFNKQKFKYYGWADPQRTYKEKPEFLYPSEEKLMLKEMEFGAAATQHNYTPIGMPEIFRHKTLTPLTRLQSWWMNHYFRFTEEALRRGFTGKPTYSDEGGPILPWKYRLGWLRYALIAVPILNQLRYQRSYFFGAAPTGMPPFAQFAQGMYNYVVGKGAGNDQQWKRGKKLMIDSGKTFIPGYMAYKDFEAIWSGRKDLSSLFFYKKR